MAADGDVIDSSMELEAMKRDDCSWHPCQVYLSPNETGLVVEYGNDGSKETLVNEKEALMHLRVRSLPLQDDDCTHIKEGDHVVVDKNSQAESCFFDAEVEKVSRVRHSKRMRCRCTFMIKWLHQDLHGGSLTVPSSSIMRLANKSINNHPTISAFIDATQLSNSSFSGMSPQLNVVNDIDLDLHDLLEKQIEGIRNSVNGSKKKIRDEMLGLEGGPETQLSTKTSRLTRAKRSREAEVKYQTSPVLPSPSTEEELPDIRSPLNPLAARAALASLMSKLPRTLEFSLNHDEQKGFTEFSLKAEASDFRQAKKTSPEIETRSTRAPVQKVKGIHDDNIEKSSSRVVRNKSSNVTNRRITRSLLHKDEEKQTIDTSNVVEYDNTSDESEKKTLFTTPSPFAEIDSGPTSRRKILSKMEKGVKGTKNSGNTRRATRSLVNKDTANLEMGSVKEAGSNGTNANNDSLPSEQRNKKRNITTQDSEGNMTSHTGCNYGSRTSSHHLKKHEVRSSPRTRSQNKA